MKLKAIVIKPGKYARVEEIDLSYHSLHSLVGGYIEMTYPFPDDEIAVISNEEAKLLDLAPNRAIRRADGSVIDIYCGVMVVVALAPEGEYRSLTTEEVNHVMAVWERPESKSDWDGAKPNTTIRVFAGNDLAEMVFRRCFGMILERMSEEEFDRLSRLIEPQVKRIEARTGLQRKFIREVLIVSAFLLARENSKNPLSLDQYIAKHCNRIASDLGFNLYDVRDVVDSWVIELVSSQTGKEDRA